MRVLVIHHVRKIGVTDVYLDDSYLNANATLYGAQELDTWAGVRLLSKISNVWRVEICPNSSEMALYDEFGKLQAIASIVLPHTTKAKMDFGYLKALLTYADPTIAFFSTSSIRKAFVKMLLKADVDFLWFDTQFYSSLLPKNSYNVVRSVNFESLHVLTEDPTKLRYLRSLLKLYSEYKIVNSKKVDKFLPISFRDRDWYGRLSGRSLEVLPLRQLPFINPKDYSLELDRKSILILGSTYDVRHNRLNLKFILEEIAPLALKRNIAVEFHVYGNRLPNLDSVPSNVVFKGFDVNMQGHLMGALATLVPWSGGAGMQSKLFEPLTLGVPVIANQQNFAGYDFTPGVDFLEATNAESYLECIEILLGDEELGNRIGEQARTQASEIFKMENYLQVLRGSFSI